MDGGKTRGEGEGTLFSQVLKWSQRPRQEEDRTAGYLLTLRMKEDTPVVEEEHGASLTQGTNSDMQRWSGRRLEKEGVRQEDKGN